MVISWKSANRRVVQKEQWVSLKIDSDEIEANKEVPVDMIYYKT